MTSQLLLLLGKSWKTFYRSRGWLITQCVITLLLLAFVGKGVYEAGKMLSPDERKRPNYEDSLHYRGEMETCKMERYSSGPVEHRCLNEKAEVDSGQCPDDIKDSIRAIFGKQYVDPCTKAGNYTLSPGRRFGFVWHTKPKRGKWFICVAQTISAQIPPITVSIFAHPYRDYLQIRSLNESAVDIDYISHDEECVRTSLKQASDQYIPMRYWADASWIGCKVVHDFHFFAQQAGVRLILYFKAMQQFTDLSITHALSSGQSNEKMNIQVVYSLEPPASPSLFSSPYGKWMVIMANLIPLLLFCLEASVEVAQESSNLIKDYLLSMGMSRLFYFLHHFIFNFLKAWIVVILFTSIIGGILKSLSLFFFIFITFSLALGPFISMSLAIGSCFKKPGMTVLMTIVLWIAMMLMTVLLKINRTSVLSILCSLNPVYAIQLAFDSRRENDMRDVPIWFSEVTYAIPQGYYILMLVFDSIFYFFLAVFIDWLASSCENPLTLLIQLARRNKDGADEASKKALLDNQEKSDDQNPAELIIEGLHKVYSTGQHVVRGIDLRLHKGQVTALLGHNGAGKSTTFSMISGMIVPTKGRIEVRGSESMADRQKLIGFCPQYNPIFPKLTVDEHLDFFARLKGFDSGTETGNRVLTILGLRDKGGERAINLSGGMKRKLCMAISMAADPPIVLLDEPTAGLDPGARRDFEKLLLEWKKEHAILLTTHYTDEAEVLADRIFIMAKGKIFCSGSAQYLRKKFDSGYVLSFAVQNESDVERASTELMKIVQGFVPNVSLYKSRGKQFEFKLSTDDCTRFVDMFRKIEEAGPCVGMQSYGLSLNQLEQVFLKVGEMTGTVDRTAEVQTALKELIEENDYRVSGPVKVMKQFGHTLMKRLLFDIAHIKSLILILAVVFGCTFLLVRERETSSKIEEIDRANVLYLTDYFRIGIHPSLDNHPNIEQIVKQYGAYLTIDRTSDNVTEWYKSQWKYRPPIIGVLSKVGQNWTIDIQLSEKNEILPTLEAIAAQINNPSLGKLRYGVEHKSRPKPNMTAGEGPEDNDKRPVMRRETKDDFIEKLRIVLTIIAPFIVIRPMAFLIIERVSNFGHQERLTGVNRVVFLCSSIFYDFLIFLFSFIAIIVACFAANAIETTSHLAEVIYFPILIFMSGELFILLMYRLFASRAKGEISLIMLMFFFGLLPLGITFIKKQIVDKGLSYAWFPFFLLNPMMASHMWKEELDDDKSSGYISGPFFIVAHFLILFVAFLLVEFRICRLCRRKQMEPMDQSVLQQPENQGSTLSKKIESNSKRNSADPSAVSVQQTGDDYVLRVDNLQKWYGGRKNRFYAVKGISFGVRSHECFGVLGVNGAGKSSTFEVLTGNALPDGGSASVGGVDCSAAPQIGYCPQADALVEDLTGRQSLVILAALHGYQNPRRVADIVITCVGMQEHANKKSKRYSGGQRRKISVAASLLAQNSLIILDEPTAGIDPIARRDIWSVICALREQTNTAIVLTSHSMDEVEALVSNMIIMRAGSIVVEGSPQMIKNLYGDHYSFNLTIENRPKVGEITTHVTSVFPTATLYDSASLRNIKYRIPRHNGDVFSSIFEKAATIAEQLNASDFCFTQATLEDAFMLAATAPQQQDVPGMEPVVPGTVSAVEPGAGTEKTAIEDFESYDALAP